MGRSLVALVASATPLCSGALVLLTSWLFPIVDGRRDTGAGIAIAALALLAIVSWPVGLGLSIFAVRRAEEDGARNAARAALALSSLGGVLLLVSCALVGILVAGLSFR